MTHLREALTRGRAYLAIILLVLAWPVAVETWHHVSESRAWRDLTGRTPFHSVIVTRAALTPRGGGIVWGNGEAALRIRGVICLCPGRASVETCGLGHKPGRCEQPDW